MKARNVTGYCHLPSPDFQYPFVVSLDKARILDCDEQNALQFVLYLG
ncbi:MAG: hypothetical protein ACE5HC_14205 [Candidatus Binatia bacterium]